MLNEWRALVGVAPVAHDPLQTDGCRKHAEYYRLNRQTGHFEDPLMPGYTVEGHEAAASSVLSYGYRGEGPYTWEDAVYHRAGLLAPRLATTGFWGEHSIACMGVFGRGERTEPSLTTHPYPYDGQHGVATEFSCNEIPNPCLSVPGNPGDRATGFILSVQFNGPWAEIEGPEVAEASLEPAGGGPVPITVEDVNSARASNLDAGLDVIPHAPLSSGTWYEAGVSGFLRVSEGGEETEIPFSKAWRFQTESQSRNSETQSRSSGLRLGLDRGVAAIHSRSPSPVTLEVSDGRSNAVHTLMPQLSGGESFTASIPLALKTASWRVCASQPSLPEEGWNGARVCRRARSLRLRLQVLALRPRQVKVGIVAPLRSSRGKVSVTLSASGKTYLRRTVKLRRKARITLSRPPDEAALLRVMTGALTADGLPYRALGASRRLPLR